MNTKNIFWWMFFKTIYIELSQFIIGKFIIINFYVLPAVNSLLSLYLFFYILIIVTFLSDIKLKFHGHG